MKRSIFILLNLIFYITIHSQNYRPIDTADHVKRELFAKKFSEDYKLYLKDLKSKINSKNNKEVENNIKEFSQDFEKEIKDGQFIFDTGFSKKVDEILAELRKNNPNVPKNTKILISKDGSLNAYCIIDGTFVVNIGLFYWLEDEDQIASILAHEIAHKILEHPLKTLIRSANEDFETKKTVKSLKKQYNKADKALKIFKEKMYETGEYRRKHEIEADSLGYTLLKNSKYNKHSFIKALELAELYDTIKPKGLQKDIYKKVFNLPNQPFNEDWLKMENYSDYKYDLYKEKLNEDSISSHPETIDRIERLKKMFPELNSQDKKEKKTNDEFDKLSRIAEFERIPNLYFNEKYGYAIYLCLINIEKEKNIDFYNYWLGKCFKKIYEARKSYTLNRYLDQIYPKEQSESYQQFLSFMWNLSINEIKSISDFYNK